MNHKKLSIYIKSTLLVLVLLVLVACGKKYTVVWKNWDGTVLETDEKVKADAPHTYDGATPSKEGNAQYSYTFKGWSEPTYEEGAITYTATFNETLNQYTIKFLNEDGSLFFEESVSYGQMPQGPSTSPAKAGSDGITYAFKDWGEEVTNVTGDKNYTASFYTCFAITFVNDDNSEIATLNVRESTMPVLNSTPKKASDATYSYSFKGWDQELAPATEVKTYKATYDKTYIEYCVKFVDFDGTVISEVSLHYGDSITAPANPTRAEDQGYTYSFKDWGKEVGKVTGNATYTAEYTATPKIYEITFLNYDMSLLLKKNVEYGTVPTYDGETPVKANSYASFEFIGWTTELSEVSGNTTYVAKFREYDVIESAYKYVLSDDGLSCKITGLNYNLDAEANVNVYIPDAINGIPVTEIGDNAFRSVNTIKTMFIGKMSKRLVNMDYTLYKA